MYTYCLLKGRFLSLPYTHSRFVILLYLDLTRLAIWLSAEARFFR